MRVLVTGNLGYVGSVTAQYLGEQGMTVFGLDAGLFRDCNLDSGHIDVPTTYKDIRDTSEEDFFGFDAVVHLAALSNDPIGELDPDLTFEINRDAAIRTAELARAAGVARFIYASTQSIYGLSESDEELSEEGPKNPQTSYAISKWEAEQVILGMASDTFVTCALRPSTVFGWSPRLRSDIVFNNLLLSGLSKGVVEVHSDGKPWRPVVHVLDLCAIISLALRVDKIAISGKAYNVGKLDGNHTVEEIARSAQDCLGDVDLVFKTEDIRDSRSYRVSFLKAREELGFTAERGLRQAGLEILRKIEQLELDLESIRGRTTNRLQQVAYLKERGLIDETLRFI
jgi:nucleoside-diphosphate-sugar epimerase